MSLRHRKPNHDPPLLIASCLMAVLLGAVASAKPVEPRVPARALPATAVQAGAGGGVERPAAAVKPEQDVPQRSQAGSAPPYPGTTAAPVPPNRRSTAAPVPPIVGTSASAGSVETTPQPSAEPDPSPSSVPSVEPTPSEQPTVEPSVEASPEPSQSGST